MEPRQSEDVNLFVPLAVQKLAHAYHLGDVQAIYAQQRPTVFHRVSGLFCIVIGLCILLVYFLTYTQFFIAWPLWQSLLVPLVGAGWLLFGIWVFATTLRPLLSVFVYPDGMIYALRKRTLIRWEQITKLWKEVRIDDDSNVFHTYRLQLVDRSQYILPPDLSENEQLGQLLEQITTPRLYPLALMAFHAGRPVTFDALTVEKQGIRVQKRLLPWKEVAHISIDDLHTVVFKKHDARPWASLQTATISNIGVLKDMIDYMRYMLARDMPATAYALYRAGVVLDFGALRVSRQGVLLENGVRLPWKDIASINAGESEVIIRRRGQLPEWLAVSNATLNDLPVLRDLLLTLARYQR